MPTINCPICENDNSIQRVSAVVAGGISTGSFSGPTTGTTYSDGKVGVNGTYTKGKVDSSTNIANILDLPLEPKNKSDVFPSLLIFPGLLSIIIGFSMPRWNDGGSVCVGNGFLYFLVAIFWLVNNNSKNKTINSIEKPNWDIYKKKWEQQYYCHKHGIVFDPETNKTCEPAQIKDFINELIKDQIIKSNSSVTGEPL